MTTYVHGKNSAFLHGAYRLSPWINSVKTTQTTQAADTSHFESNSKTYIVGQNDGTITFAGLYDGTTGAINDVMSAAIQSGVVTPVTFTPEGVSVGAAAVLALSESTTYDIENKVSDVEAINGTVQVTGGITPGVLLSDASDISASTDFDSVDLGAGSTLGARSFLHVITNTSDDDFDAVVQHSTDNTVWVDLITFTTVPTVTTSSEYLSVTGAVNRYVRLHTTLSGSDGVTAIVGFARN